MTAAALQAPAPIRRVPARPAPNAPAPGVGDPAEAFRPRLNRLRLHAARCRASARLDLFRACARLSADRGAASQAHAEALVRGLAQAFGRPPIFYRPGADPLSDDEAWLLRALDRAAAGDHASLAFLLHTRAAPAHRRALGFLIGNVARAAADL
ncbi:MAG: hypothetical protein AAF192_06400 [Pseudomonadota bacterium]